MLDCIRKHIQATPHCLLPFSSARVLKALKLCEVTDGLCPTSVLPTPQVADGPDVDLGKTRVVVRSQPLQGAHRRVQDLRHRLRLPSLVKRLVDVHVCGLVTMPDVLGGLAGQQATRNLKELPPGQVLHRDDLAGAQHLRTQRRQALQRAHGLAHEGVQGACLDVLVQHVVQVHSVGLGCLVLLLQDLHRLLDGRIVHPGLLRGWLGSHGGLCPVGGQGLCAGAERQAGASAEIAGAKMA
mmetsp:Transcript_18751/g.50902  ORF Transcript_18751/g.50902 Transcript_18751/m.50902 type:complete len:240 (-) Transcript_18751:18-737(-)